MTKKYRNHQGWFISIEETSTGSVHFTLEDPHGIQYESDNLIARYPIDNPPNNLRQYLGNELSKPYHSQVLHYNGQPVVVTGVTYGLSGGTKWWLMFTSSSALSAAGLAGLTVMTGPAGLIIAGSAFGAGFGGGCYTVTHGDEVTVCGWAGNTALGALGGAVSGATGQVLGHVIRPIAFQTQVLCSMVGGSSANAAVALASATLKGETTSPKAILKEAVIGAVCSGSSGLAGRATTIVVGKVIAESCDDLAISILGRVAGTGTSLQVGNTLRRFGKPSEGPDATTVLGGTMGEFVGLIKKAQPINDAVELLNDLEELDIRPEQNDTPEALSIITIAEDGVQREWVLSSELLEALKDHNVADVLRSTFELQETIIVQFQAMTTPLEARIVSEVVHQNQLALLDPESAVEEAHNLYSLSNT